MKSQKRRTRALKYQTQPEVVVLAGIDKTEIRIPEIKVRLNRGKIFKTLKNKTITSSVSAAEILRSVIGVSNIETQENFLVLYLDQSNNVLGYYKHTIGTQNAVMSDPVIILGVAVKCLAKSMILAHNHPSGNTKPSQADINMSSNMAKAASTHDIKILDSIIVTKESHFSFADEGISISGCNLNGLNNLKGTTMITKENIITEYPKITITLPDYLSQSEFDFIEKNMKYYDKSVPIKTLVDLFVEKLNAFIDKSSSKDSSRAVPQVPTLTNIPKVLKMVMPNHQRKVIIGNKEIWDVLQTLAATIEKTPKLYAQDGKGKHAIVYLHYFLGNSDWFITEWDRAEASFYGYAILNGDTQMAEFGYIPVSDLVNDNKVELDFYWDIKTVNEAIGSEKEPTASEEAAEHKETFEKIKKGKIKTVKEFGKSIKKDHDKSSKSKIPNPKFKVGEYAMYKGSKETFKVKILSEGNYDSITKDYTYLAIAPGWSDADNVGERNLSITDDQKAASKRKVKTHPKSNPETVKKIKEVMQKEHASNIIPKNTTDLNVIKRFVKMLDSGAFYPDKVLNLYKFIEKAISDKSISKTSEYGTQVVEIANYLKKIANSFIQTKLNKIYIEDKFLDIFKELRTIIKNNEIDLSVTLIKAYVNIQTSRDVKKATALQKRINNAIKNGALTAGMIHYKEVTEIKDILQKYIDGKAPNIEPPVGLSGLGGYLAGYRWKPSKSQKREFAENMKNPEFAAGYYARKEAKADKRRSTSKFDYEKAGGEYVPTKAQYEYAMSHIRDKELSVSDRAAFNEVISGYNNNEKVHHDNIHIVNEYIRKSK